MNHTKKITPEQAFTNGLVYALARLIEEHDQPTMATSIFEGSGIPNHCLERCDQGDADFLRKALAEK